MFEIAAGIFAVAKAFNGVMTLVGHLSEAYIDYQIGQLEDLDSHYIAARRGISNALENTHDREELKALSIELAFLNRKFVSKRHK